MRKITVRMSTTCDTPTPEEMEKRIKFWEAAKAKWKTLPDTWSADECLLVVTLGLVPDLIRAYREQQKELEELRKGKDVSKDVVELRKRYKSFDLNEPYRPLSIKPGEENPSEQERALESAARRFEAAIGYSGGSGKEKP